jgi:hypothetical protein
MTFVTAYRNVQDMFLEQPASLEKGTLEPGLRRKDFVARSASDSFEELRPPAYARYGGDRSDRVPGRRARRLTRFTRTYLQFME